VARVIDDNEIELQLADNVKIRQLRSMISEVRAKGEPAKDEGAA
jgi:preprotein translocase subunit YajC